MRKQIKDPVFDYSKLLGRIKEICGTNERFAEAIGLGRGSLSKSLNNKREFTQPEMLISAQVLDFPVSEIPVYFFTAIVQKHEQN